MAPNAGDLAKPNAGQMPVGGTAGLPRTDVDAQGNIFFKFVRRNTAAFPDVIYEVEESGDMTSWSTYTGTPTVESLDSNWERVTCPIDPGFAPKIFLRLKVRRP
jgi:hypothetical protein